MVHEQSGNDKGDELLSHLQTLLGSGKVSLRQHQLVKRESSGEGPADLFRQQQQDKGIARRAEQSSALCGGEETLNLLETFKLKEGGNPGIGLPALGLFPDQQAHDLWMRDHIIKECANGRSEKRPKPLGFENQSRVGVQRFKQVGLFGGGQYGFASVLRAARSQWEFGM
jgi:hypothetical protein